MAINRATQNWPEVRRLATMYRLDWRGRVDQTRYVEYHSTEWMTLCSLGFVTHTVDEVK